MYIQGQGPIGAKIMIVGDMPVASDEATGIPFSGTIGGVLDGIFEDLGFKDWRNQCYVTYIHKHNLGLDEVPSYKACVKGNIDLDSVWAEIEAVNPNLIVAMDDLSLEVLTGMDSVYKFRGSLIMSKDHKHKVLATIHPANIVRPSDASGDYRADKAQYGYIWRKILMFDLERAINESKYSDLRLPERALMIAHTSADVYRHIQNNRGKIAVMDVETIHSTLVGCLCLAFTKYESLTIPMFRQIENRIITTQPESDLAFTWQLLDKFFRENLIIGHNLKFDQVKLELLGFRFKGIKSDTMLKMHTVNPELPNKSLVFGASIWTREPHWKDEGKEFIPGKHDVKRWLNYNAKDGAVNKELDDALEEELKGLSEQYKTDLVGFYYKRVVPLHDLYSALEKVGFDNDQGQRQFLIDRYETWLSVLEAKLFAQVGHSLNFNSPKQVATLLYEELGLKPVYYKGKVKTDEGALSKILDGELKERRRREIIQGLLEYRRVSKTLGTYLRSGVDFDGRIRTQYRITGTETGRSSTSVIDEPTRPVSSGVALQTLTKHGDIGEDVRSVLIPRPKHVLVNVDLSQAEARIVALLSNDDELLGAFDTIDIHRRTAALALITGKLILKGPDPIADAIGKDSSERFVGKKTRHAGNYDMKKMRFHTEIISDARRFGIDFTLSPYKAGKILEAFHEASPRIKGVFHKEVQEALNETRCLITPHGRVRTFWGRYTDSLYQEAYASIPQGTVIDHLREVWMRIDRQKIKEIKVCGEAHDALTFQLPKDEYEAIVKEVIKPAFDLEIDFSGCSIKRGKLKIPCDVEVGDNYKDMMKMSKYKELKG